MEKAELESQNADQERAIDQLKQIVCLQERLRSSEFDHLKGGLKAQVQRNIESFVREVDQTGPLQQRLAWVSELSELALTKDLSRYGSSLLDRTDKISEKSCEHSSTENLSVHQQAATHPSARKLTKEQTIQTEEVQILPQSAKHELETTSQLDRASLLSSTTTQRERKHFSMLSADLKQNMNELLGEQL